MEKSKNKTEDYSDETLKLVVKYDKIELEKAKTRFEKSYNQLLKEEIAKGKELDTEIREIINQLSDKQKQLIKNEINEMISKN